MNYYASRLFKLAMLLLGILLISCALFDLSRNLIESVLWLCDIILLGALHAERSGIVIERNTGFSATRPREYGSRTYHESYWKSMSKMKPIDPRKGDKK